ncbi:hypothetical protein KJ656_12550, partial [bacterium]|nr:hypothetical protein [bacterium]
MENLLKNIDNQNGLIDIKYDDTHSHLQKKRTKINHNDVRTTIQMLKKELKAPFDIFIRQDTFLNKIIDSAS